MSYEELFELAGQELRNECRDLITSQRHGRWWNEWLLYDADNDFGLLFQSIFKKHFERYVTQRIGEDLYLAGNHISFALSSFCKFKPYANTSELVEYIDHFVSEQLNDFGNWCQEIGMAMYEESSEYERENGIRPPEDNPS